MGRQCQPHHPHGLNEIALKRAAPLLVGTVGNARPAAAPDIVDQDIDPPKGGDRRLHEPRGLVRLPDIGEAPEFTGTQRWFNSPPLTMAGLRGRVVLIDFWTYTCVNCIRTQPYLKAWDARYRRAGLTIVGVHSPEFEFEKNIENVRRAVKDMKIDYPVAVDSRHEVWRAFNNQYWPALYFIDAQGRIRHSHFGEGEYERAEATIQQLLA